MKGFYWCICWKDQKKKKKILDNFANFSKQEMNFTEEENTQHLWGTTCHKCKDKFIAKDTNIV